MKKTMIATDSASTFTLEEAATLNIAILPLTVIIDQDIYRDVFDISTETVYEAVRQNKSVSTSQVNIGFLEEQFRLWDKEYDEIVVLSVPKSLSGTYSTMRLVIEQLELSHKIHLFDCSGLGGIQQSIVKIVIEKIRNDESLATLETEIKKFVTQSSTLVIPQTLDQLKKGGRLTGAAAMMATLLKIKPILKIVKEGQVIDKYEIAKTDKKINEIILKDIEDLKLQDHELMIYLLHADNRKRIEEVEILIKTRYPMSSIKIINLPPVLVAHTGMGCIAMQACKK